ncbi:UDP-N-acetylmuramoyl-L-alanine--D-glutamate ligase [Candidatus Saccharibacteria bacterium]|nr:UDP-N-acetylmuramoyl-L-alanine--D-glutamate ligase [Candidatus Saccharibacteria bacterium]
MNILILGYGIEGKSVENYFKHQTTLKPTAIDILDHFQKEELLFKDFSNYDLIFRTPSIPPKFIPAPEEKITSVTKYFFDNCPCPIIGVTGTKGKGTTCTIIKDILTEISVHKQASPNVYLLGNIGTPALDILPKLKKTDIVIYELSSFQLWDLKKSPSISVVLRLEPDHLDVHESFSEYLQAKQNIVNFQTKSDYCIFFGPNKNTQNLVQETPAKKLPYPCKTVLLNADETSEKTSILSAILSHLQVPGNHNREDAEAALLASYAYSKKYQSFSGNFSSFLKAFQPELSSALKNFRALPHHIEFVRELNSVKYYDDSFSTVLPSLEAALNAFPSSPIVLIAGGKDKGFDLAPAKQLIFSRHNLIKAVLIGEIAPKLAQGEDPQKYVHCGTDFELAIKTAQRLAESYLNTAEANSDTCLIDAKPKITPPVVLLSPCASSFDMFQSYKQRGDIFKKIVNNLS